MPITPTIRPRPPIVSPYAPSLQINNNSCRNITTVLIDGATQLTGIGPGEVGNFHMDNRCNHNVEGISGEVTWTSNIRCQGVPYDNYTLIFNSSSITTSLPEDLLIVGTRSNSYNGDVEITNKSDCITIEKVVANRGNCNVASPEARKTLKFGQTLTIPYFCEKLLELNVDTDQGTGVFTFER